VGKSTLINKLIGEKITITSPIAQTTRNKLKGILTTKNGQIIFVDTPGVHKPHHRLGEILVKNAKSAIYGVDMVIFVIDSSEEPGRGDEYILNFLIANKTDFIVALNKWDLVNKEFRNLRLDQYRRFFGINKSIFSLYCFGSIEIIKLTANTNINFKRPEPRFPAIFIKFLKLS